MTDQAPWQDRSSLGPLLPASREREDGRSDASEPSGIHDVVTEAESVLRQARDAKHGKGTRVLWTGPHQRVVLMAMTAGTRLADHESPPAASFHVITGSARLYAAASPAGEGRGEWVVGAGQLVAIPPERHGVEALTDCAILLTVSLVPKETT